MKKILPLFFIFFIVAYFFRSFIFYNLLPIPSDTIVGLYHPYRDLYAKQFPRGIPFKNFLITDPVRQLYPWRNLAISAEKKLQLPVWNPYTFSGTPLLANFQSAAFYPLNIIFFILPFSTAWSILIFAQPLLAGIFLFLYLKNLKMHPFAAFLGAVTYAFCGFSIAWMEWNNIVQVALWLPLILLAKDKLLKKWTLSWTFIFLFSEISAFLGGHIQILFYSLIISNAYLFLRVYQKTKLESKKQNFFFSYAHIYLPFLLVGICVFIITAAQWIPTLQFISLSARDVDQLQWQSPGWFIPWQNLVQFIAPDFFGNPATLNYFGIWNYGEFIGFIGIMPLLMAFVALIFRHDKKTYFFTLLCFLALLFSLPNPISKIPYILHVPFLSTAQPTRLMFVEDFSLAILAALGLDYYMKLQRKIFIPISIFSIFFLLLWTVIFFHQRFLPSVSLENIFIARRNLIFPTGVFVGTSIVLVLFAIFRSKISERIQKTIYLLLILIALVDLLRFGQKFISFSPEKYLFPQSGTITFLQKNVGDNRIAMLDSRIFPPNFSIMYRLQTIEGYDPLYLKTYGELVAAAERNTPNISSPFGFNRIITPHRYSDTNLLINLTGVKYVLSLSQLSQPWFKQVFKEGETYIYENTGALPRTFFVSQIEIASKKEQAIELLFAKRNTLRTNAVVEGELAKTTYSSGNATLFSYKENEVKIKTENTGEGFLVLTDTFYPTWHASIDGEETNIYNTDYAFRGIVVPPGEHIITFYDTLF